jgi:hypothetical protein
MIERIDEIIESIMAWDAARERQQAAQKFEVRPTPCRDFDEIVGTGQYGA